MIKGYSKYGVRYLQSLFGLHVHVQAVLIGWDPATPPPPIWAHKRGCYWSAKIDGISLWPMTIRIAWDLATLPPPAFVLIYEGAIGQLRAQDKRHLLVSPWSR